MCADKTCQSSTGSRRSAQFHGSCAAIVGLVETSGWLSKGLFFEIRLRSAGSRWMPGRAGGCGHPPLRGYDGGPATGGHTGPPLQAPSCRGRRPRRPAFTARVAPAKRERQGIRDFPGPKDSPRETRLMKPKRGTANHPPPAAGGTRLRGPTRRGDFFSWTVHGPFSFCQEQKENGGCIAAAIAASSGRPQVAPTLPPGRVHLLGHHHG